MNLEFPSAEFDHAVEAACHGTMSEEQAGALNVLLRGNRAALDEYVFCVELHSRLASDPDLFTPLEFVAPTPRAEQSGGSQPRESRAGRVRAGGPRRRRAQLAMVAGLILAAAGWWSFRTDDGPVAVPEPPEATSTAVAMLNGSVDAVWGAGAAQPRRDAPMEPGWLKLKSGMVQIVFYSGARVAIQGPAEFELVSQNQASCRRGRITVDVPPQARDFRVETPQTRVGNPGASFGLEVGSGRTELHVFDGTVSLTAGDAAADLEFAEGDGVVIEPGVAPRHMTANRAPFASLFDLRIRSMAAESRRYDQWRAASEEVHADPSLLVHLDFEKDASFDWSIPNLGHPGGGVADATVVGCRPTSGRWPEKRALDFQSVNDRVRLSVPGRFDSLTLAAWVRVQGLDRKINSLFMSDGFAPGTIHWLIRNDGVLGLTVIGSPASDHQVVTSPAVLTLDRFGMWLHVAVVLDGIEERVAHFLNGVEVGGEPLRVAPPFRVGVSELGNWNPRGFPSDNPFHIRNFSGAMDEFFLFDRALSADEIKELHAGGEPQTRSPVASVEPFERRRTP